MTRWDNFLHINDYYMLKVMYYLEIRFDKLNFKIEWTSDTNSHMVILYLKLSQNRKTTVFKVEFKGVISVNALCYVHHIFHI